MLQSCTYAPQFEGTYVAAVFTISRLMVVSCEAKEQAASEHPDWT